MINPASLHGVSLQRLLDMLMTFSAADDGEGVEAVRREIQRRDANQKKNLTAVTVEVKRQGSALRKANERIEEFEEERRDRRAEDRS